MKIKKFLLLILALCMVFTVVTSITVVNAADVTVVNVGQGETYTLPTEINDVSVQWTDASGSSVTVADTSLPGYRYYEGALTDGTTVKYRVNVGEFVTKYENLLADFDVNCVDATATNQQQFTKGDGRLVVASVDAEDVQVVNYDASTKAIKYGPNKVIYTSFVGSSTTFSGSYSVSMRIKLEDIVLPESNDVNHVTLRLGNIDSTEILSVLIYVQSDGKIMFYPNSNKNTTHNASKTYINVDVVDGKSPWIDVRFDVYENLTWNCAVNDTYLFTGKGFYYSDASKYSEIKFSRAIVSDKVDSNGVAYSSDIEVKNLRHFTGELPEAIDATIAKGDSAAQTIATTLTMNDDTTKEFTVKYTADTSKAGVQTVNGTIDGFDDTIPVTVTVEDKNIITGITASDTAVEKAAIQKVGSIASGVAIFAYYDSSDKMKIIKLVPFTESDFTGDTAEISVGLVFPENTEGGYIKGFVINDMENLIPLDEVYSPQ